MQITQTLIDEIIQKVNIVEVVGDYVQLEKKGRNYVGLCPFHADNNPSMSVSEEKHIYKCFSCGAGGNAIKFVQDFENISFPDAARKVAGRVGISLDIKSNPYQKFFDINKAATAFFKVYLLNTDEGKQAQAYLSSRGISSNTIKEFEIGLAPSKNILYETLRQRNFESLDIVKSGLVNKSGDEFIDTFRSRIVFPIKDKNGNYVGFSGRSLSKDSKAKYINSAESNVFKKSRLLYHFQEARTASKQSKRIILMEGFMDVIAAHKAGVRDTVATMGTALTKEHINLLKSLTSRVTICFDGDEAGIEAAYKSAASLRDFEIKVVVLPDGLDPDDFIKKYGDEAFIKEINEEAMDLFNFLYQYHLSKTDKSNINEIEKFKRTIFGLLQNASNVQIDLYLKRLAQHLNVSEESIRNDFQLKKQPIRESKVKTDDFAKYIKAEQILIKHMMKGKEIALSIDGELDHNYVDMNNQKIKESMIRYYASNTVFDLDSFLSLLAIDLQEYFRLYILQVEDVNDKGIADCIKTIKEHPLKAKLNFLMSQLNDPQFKNKVSPQELEELRGEIFKLLQSMKGRKVHE